MHFNSHIFIFLYLPVVFIGTFWLGKQWPYLSACWLVMASLTFYAVWNTPFILLMLASVVFNYGAGYWIAQKRTNIARKHLLITAITLNLLLLFYFKYSIFFISSFNLVAESNLTSLDIILPLGISFFTFTQIAFLVDVYRGIAREYNFIYYLLFVTYFPHLIAGPILHHKQMMPQFANSDTYHIDAEHVAAGLTIFVLGLSKKVLIADTVARYATPVFNAARDGQVLMLLEAWIGAIAYTLQLYFDFSGYSDMAIGLSLLFNVRLPLNFDSPYKSVNIIEFWRRWHMTLSAFLRDYLYFPLGGSHKGRLRQYVNVMATMLLGGLWHGAGWTFILWGGLHGLYLMINHGWHDLKTHLGLGYGGNIARVIAIAITFLAVVVAWVLFRAPNLATAGAMLSGMSGANGLSLPVSFAEQIRLPVVMFLGVMPATKISAIGALSSITLSLLIVWFFPNVRQIMRKYNPTWEDIADANNIALSPLNVIGRNYQWRPTMFTAVICGAIMFICLLTMGHVSEFLYFQF